MQLFYEKFMVEGDPYELAAFAKNLEADEIQASNCCDGLSSTMCDCNDYAVKCEAEEFICDDCAECETTSDFEDVLDDLLAKVSSADMNHEEKFNIMDVIVYLKENYSA